MTSCADIFKSLTQDKSYLCFLNGVCQSRSIDAMQFDTELGEIQIQPKASLTLVMVYDDCYQHQIINIGAQASVNIVLIYDRHVEHTLAIAQASASQVKVAQIALDVQTLKNSIHVDLKAELARCNIEGIQFADDQQTLSTTLAVFHRVANTHSEIIYKSMADQKAEISILAHVHVSPGALKTTSATSLNNLLLSNSALIDTRPELEIYADDVKCSHGATVGDLNEDSLFYLISRGIDPQQARVMLMQAFLQGLIDQLDPLIQPHVMAKIQRTLASVGVLT